MAFKTVSQGPFIKGVVASNQPLAQPKGSVQRISNLILSSRGALTQVDGSRVLHAFGGQISSGRGRILASFLFQPTGVLSYYLVLAAALEQSLGAPRNLAASVTSGGSLVSGTTYYYQVTALDGVGGETNASLEVNATPSGGNLSVALTWNVVPNAWQYNVYRSTSPGGELLLVGTGLPVSQVSPGNLSVGFTDTGVASALSGLSLSSATYTLPASLPSQNVPQTFIFKTVTPHGLSVGSSYVIAGVTPSSPFNGANQVTSVLDSLTIETIDYVGGGPAQMLSGTGGNISSGGTPVHDTTQQIVLYKMPAITGNPAVLPVSYSDANIVALYPAILIQGSGTSPSTTGGTGGGAGGGGGSGGGGGTGGTGGGGGRQRNTF